MVHEAPASHFGGLNVVIRTFYLTSEAELVFIVLVLATSAANRLAQFGIDFMGEHSFVVQYLFFYFTITLHSQKNSFAELNV